MTTKRRPLKRSPGPAITAEMVERFARCVERRARLAKKREPSGCDDHELQQWEKRLNITLLRLPWHACSVCDPALDRKQPPSYLRPEHAMFRD
jgi:hypothetical protein